jgi:hypothetical protein
MYMRIQRANKAFVFIFVMLAALHCSGQTDVGASVYGALSATTSGDNSTESPSYAAGGLLELRHIFNPVRGFEATYSFNPAKQVYTYTGAIPASVVCAPPPGGCLQLPPTVSVSANAQEFTADWIPSKTKGALRPFGVLGAGVLLDVPSGGQSNTTTVTEPVFVYGVGMDWARWKRFGLRVQYRGNLYKSPDMSPSFYSGMVPNRSLMLTNEPMAGVYFRLP